jgi:hypothetical protein
MTSELMRCVKAMYRRRSTQPSCRPKPSPQTRLAQLARAAADPDPVRRRAAVAGLTSKLFRARDVEGQVQIIGLLAQVAPSLSVVERTRLQGDLTIVQMRTRSVEVGLAVARFDEVVRGLSG